MEMPLIVSIGVGTTLRGTPIFWPYRRTSVVVKGCGVLFSCRHAFDFAASLCQIERVLVWSCVGSGNDSLNGTRFFVPVKVC